VAGEKLARPTRAAPRVALMQRQKGPGSGSRIGTLSAERRGEVCWLDGDFGYSVSAGMDRKE
jgi:hypothetical protein